MILVNNLLFCLALFIVVLGTLFPLVLQLFFDTSISIGASYYNKLFSPISIVLLCLMIFVPSVRLNKFSSTAMFFAHIGIFIVILAIIITAIFSQTKELNMKFSDQVEMSKYKIEFLNVDYVAGKNYLARQGNFIVTSLRDKSAAPLCGDPYGKMDSNINSKSFCYKNNRIITTLKPQSRYYPENDQTTTEADIKHFLFADLYLVIGGKDEAENYAVRVYYKPFISFIWLGCGLIFIGGVWSILEKKFDRLKNT
jgi:cytochrome c-type biogenesis protein CcmF